MPTITKNDDDIYAYLAFVTLREAWEELSTWFFIWFIFSAVGVAVVLIAEAGFSRTEDIWPALPELPRQVWVTVGFAAFTLIGRGQKITIAIPRSLGIWFAMVAAVALLGVASLVLPDWGALPVGIGIPVFAQGLGRLAETGKANYLKLSAQQIEKP